MKTKKETLEVCVDYKGLMDHEYNLEIINQDWLHGNLTLLRREGSDWADHVKGEVCCDCEELEGDQYKINVHGSDSTTNTLVLDAAQIFELYVLLGGLSSVNELGIEYKKTEIVRRVPAIEV
jgi:hypothetical protein